MAANIAYEMLALAALADRGSPAGQA